MLAPVLGVNTCTRDGDHVFRYETAGPRTPCGITVNISRAVAPGVKGHNKAADKAHSGVFYRQNEPYVMTATGQGFNEAAVVYSPSNAETLFLPVAKTFFANNEADFSFRDGVPTKYKQETEGEAVALLKLPAEVIAAYFKAVGGVFDSFKSNDQKEAAALNASVALELARQKYAACVDAIEQGDEDLIKSLECKD